MKPFILSLFMLVTFASFSQTIQAPSSCTAVIGSPANGPAHYLDVAWASVSGASAYEVQYSTDNGTWDSLSVVTIPITSHNTGSAGNLPFYYRVRTVENTNVSTWTNATPFPMYSACNNPALPYLSNAGSNAMDISIAPDNNSAATSYAVYCTTDSMYLQSNGTLGLTEVYKTRSTWDTLRITGLEPNVNYCFYAKAKNTNGDVRVAQANSVSFFEPWTTNVLDTTTAGPTNVWWSPDSSAWSPLQYSSTGGCSNGNVGFTGNYNNYWRSLLRSPAVNCNSLNQVTLQFNITNSSFPSHPGDKITFTMWAPTPSYPNGTFINALTVNGITGFTLPFDTVRNCDIITVVYDLSDVTDKSQILMFLNPVCPYNDANIFQVRLTNTSIGASGLASTCSPTLNVVLTGTNEIGAFDLQVYPNPFNGHFTVAMNSAFENCSAQLCDETGRKLRQFELSGNDNFDVDAAALKPGLYFLDIMSHDRKVITKKLLKVE